MSPETDEGARLNPVDYRRRLIIICSTVSWLTFAATDLGLLPSEAAEFHAMLPEFI